MGSCCGGRSDGSPANYRGGADDPMDVDQTFSAGHFFLRFCSFG